MSGLNGKEKFHKLIIKIWEKVELLKKWNDYLIVPIFRKGDRHYITALTSGEFGYFQRAIKYYAT